MTLFWKTTFYKLKQTYNNLKQSRPSVFAKLHSMKSDAQYGY